MRIQESIQKLVNAAELSYDDAYFAMKEIMDNQAGDALIGGYLTALAFNKVDSVIVAASSAAMLDSMVKLPTDLTCLDIVGTGGDKAFTFNISTAAALVCAAADIKVAKHGNRSVSSKCGAADVFEKLGLNVEMSPESAAKLLQNTNLCFMFAPVYHGSMRYCAAARKALAIPTVFNILGPLANPANAKYILLGAYNNHLAEVMANALAKLNYKHAFVVSGRDGLDELTLCDKTDVYEVFDNKVTHFEIRPEDVGLTRCCLADIQGGAADINASIIQDIAANRATQAQEDITVFNSAMAMYLYENERVSDCKKIVKNNIAKARSLIKSGAVRDKLNQIIAFKSEGA